MRGRDPSSAKSKKFLRATVKLEPLRRLREQVRRRSETLESDFRAFLHPNQITFTRRPKTRDEIDKEAKERPVEDMAKIDASSTATVLMALSIGDQLSLFYDKDKNPPLKSALTELFTDKWTSAGLKDLNFFTAALVFRALGFVRERYKETDALLAALTHAGSTYQQTVDHFRELDPAKTKVGGQGESSYPLTPTLAYWLLDAADRLSWRLGKDDWHRWAEWAAAQFYHQLSHVVAKDDGFMDPVALAMAACLVAKLRKIAQNTPDTPHHMIEAALPSMAQLRVALPELFKRQGESGVWPKYFPLFIYPKGDLVNHCFAFELLEALLHEFPNELLDEHLDNVSRSVAWCDDQRIDKYRHQSTPDPFSGWNSGANLQSLREKSPECWATAAVYMFLGKLERCLDVRISDTILLRYGDRTKVKHKNWDRLLSSRVSFVGRPSEDVKTVLERVMEDWRNGVDRRKRSALLFGPPGTSKTSLVTALAAKYQLPCVALNPGHFLKDGLEKIFGRANRIFADLMDLSNAVVFFDEMDPLVQKREAGSDIRHQSLTTVLLPHLAELHRKDRVFFFMATNHLQQIDSAIQRPGRFDCLLFVGPPRWQDKVKVLLEKDEAALKILLDWTEKWSQEDRVTNILEVLDRFTVAETESFLERFREKVDLSKALNERDIREFEDEALKWGGKYIILWETDGLQSPDFAELKKDKASSRM